MTRALGALTAALGALLLVGCSAGAGAPAPSSSPNSTQDGAARPVLAAGTTAATGSFADAGAASTAAPDSVSGSVAIRVNETGVFELVVDDLVVTDGAAVQFTLTADALSPDEHCLESDWRFGLGQADAGHDPAASLVFPIGGSDGIGQGDLSFIREVVVTRAPSGAALDKACPIPLVSHAALVWSTPDLRPGLAVADSGARIGAMGTVTLDGGDPTAYTVAQGDTLAAVADRFGIALDDLFYLNPRRSPNPEDAHAFTGELLNLSRATR
ncbi:LysM domain-containing protein [Agreia sp.]|uniref:LysM peptidoglycan-binding domain-containing protein n=1 Tax=Agreia sp. TaxID=1872416 RepID=UPI0035BBDA12